MVTYEITKPDEWIGHYFPFKEVAEAGLQPTDFLILDFFARKQEYHKHEIADSLYEVSIKITLDLISETLCIPKSTVKDSLKRSEVKEMILRAKSGISALPKFVEMFYIIEDGKLKKKITGKVKKSAESAQKAPAKENSCADSAQDSGGIRTEHLIVYNKGINVSVAEDKSVFENENQAPQVNAKTLENDSAAPPPLSVQNTQTILDDEFVNLEKDDYMRELERWLRKNHSKFTRNKEEIEYHLDNAWKNDFKFDDTRGSIMGGEKFFTYSKKFYEEALARKPKAPDKTQIRRQARELFEKCKANWKDPYRTYPAHLQIQIDMKGIKNVEEIEIDAIEKVLSGNNPKNATLLYEMYNKMSAQVYDYMKCEWGMFIKKEKEVMKILTDEYYSLKLFHVEGWPKQQL